MTEQLLRAQRRSAPGATLVISLLVGSAFVMILNETIMSVALPALITDLGVSATTVQWLTSGFLLTMAVVIPMTGALLQRFPTRGVYLTSMLLFCGGTLLAAVAPVFGVLLAARIVQACGTAVMVPLLMTTVMTLIPVERRGQTMGTISIVIAVAPAIGPTLSGLILGSLSWRWMFGIVLPIALIALAAGLTWLHVPTERVRATPIDPLSVPLSALAFAGLVLGLSLQGESAYGDAPLPAWVPAAVGAVALVLFGFRQVQLQRRERAFLDLRPFLYRRFTLSLVLIILGFTALFGAIIVLPLYVQDVLGRSALVAGSLSFPGGILMGAMGPPVGRVYDRRGPRVLVIPGAVLLCAALWGYATLGTGSRIWEIVVLQTVMMAGLSMMFTPLMTDALGVLPESLYSHGSAILTTLQQVAGAVGTALFITVLTTASASSTPDLAGVRAAFTVAAVISVLAVASASRTCATGTADP